MVFKVLCHHFCGKQCLIYFFLQPGRSHAGHASPDSNESHQIFDSRLLILIDSTVFSKTQRCQFAKRKSQRKHRKLAMITETKLSFSDRWADMFSAKGCHDEHEHMFSHPFLQVKFDRTCSPPAYLVKIKCSQVSTKTH